MGLLTVPMPVAVAAAATLVAGRVALAMRRRARTRRTRGTRPTGPASSSVVTVPDGR